ncbi:MAG: hypothetical protein WDA09_03870 [Bacteriovoracaceae bacterium]
MNLTQLMIDYYHLISKLHDEQEAREAVSGLVNIAIYDIQQTGQELNSVQLEKHITQQIIDFLEIAKKQVA